MLHLGGVQTQQMADRCGCGQRARRAGGVKDFVVRATQKFTHPNADFITRHSRRDELRAAGANGLCHRQRRWKNHRGRVKHRAIVHVVLFGHMGSAGVRHGGQVRAAATARDEHFARPLVGPHAQRKACQAVDRARVVAADGRAKPVDQQVFGFAQHGVRYVGGGQVRGKGGEGGGGARIVLAHSVVPSSARMAWVCSPTLGMASMR